MITLTFVPSETEVLSGIPKTVSIEANQPATIYYTLDGTTPTPSSSIYVGTLTMPGDVGAITLSAIAYYLDSDNNLVPSPILSETYFTDTSRLDRYRNLFFEGVVYIFPEGTTSTEFPFYYDENGEAVNLINVELDQLEFIQSETDQQGNPVALPNDVMYATGAQTPTYFDDEPVLFSSVNGSEIFNPHAQFILIDGRTGAPPQQVELINGPHMSLRDMRKTYGGVDFIDLLGSNYISGGATRPMISEEKRIIVFYYFDSDSSRWIKSIQDLPARPTDLSYPNWTSPGLVFHWFQFGRQSDGFQ